MRSLMRATCWPIAWLALAVGIAAGPASGSTSLRCLRLLERHVEVQDSVAREHLDASYRAFSDTVDAIESGFAVFSDPQLELFLTKAPPFPSDRRAGIVFSERIQDLSQALGKPQDAIARLFGVSLEDVAFLASPAAYEGAGKLRVEFLREKYRRAFEFYFWSDHGPTHYRDILRVFNRIEVHLPPSMRNSHAELFQKDGAPPSRTSWHNRISDAIRLHDSGVFQSRSTHPELAFKSAMETFHYLPLKERALRGVIALLHSKTAVPTVLLGKWLSVLREGHPDANIDRSILATPEIQKAIEVLRLLSETEQNLVIKAAELIRIADASRSLGPTIGGRLGVTNSIGRSFALDPQGNPTISIQRAGDACLFPVIPTQRSIVIGNLALGNPRFSEANGRLTIDFPFFGIGPNMGAGLEGIVKKLNDRGFGVTVLADTLSRSTDLLPAERAVLQTALDILIEYPPGALISADGAPATLRLTTQPSD